MSGEISTCAIAFSSNKNTNGYYITFVALINASQYNIEITRAMILGGSSVLSNTTLMGNSKLGFHIGILDDNVCDKTVNFSFKISIIEPI